MKKIVLLVMCLLVFGLAGSSKAADIYVSPAGGGGGTPGDPTDLQTALDTARTNGEDDTIYMQTGTYDASSSGAATFEYGTVSNDNMSVTLSGGWNVDFTSQSDDPSLTLLDGGNDSRVLEIRADATGVDIIFTLENLTIQNGYSTGLGGGIYANTGSPGSSGSIDLTVKNCLIMNNDADSNGGGMCTKCYFEVYNSTFSGNSGSSGGAMIIYDVPGGDKSLTPIIDHTTFCKNSNDGNQGSAIYNAVSPLITNCLFKENTGVGGPLYNSTSSFLTISDSIFSNNNTKYWGSAIHFWAAGGNIINCLFFDNTAANGGHGYAAITYYHGGTGGGHLINITNCTFSGNQSYDTGYASIYNRGGTLNVTNSIFWDNERTSGLYNEYGTAIISYSDVHNGLGGTGFTDGGNNINSTPSFVGGGDYHLTAASPCIDAGTNDAPHLPDKDKDGKPRIIDGDGDDIATVDMGLYEFGDICEGNFDGDDDVDGSDLAIFAADFGRTDCNQPSMLPCEGDFDGDGNVDGSDLAVFAADFGRTDCPCALNVP